MGCLVVGLTGQTGSGKSTVSRILTDCGIPVIDCDRLAREAVEPGSECLLQLVQAFGAKILQQDGSLDRAKMAAIAFPDPEKLEMLNSITHKAILRLLEKRLENTPELAGNSLERCSTLSKGVVSAMVYSSPPVIVSSMPVAIASLPVRDVAGAFFFANSESEA